MGVRFLLRPLRGESLQLRTRQAGPMSITMAVKAMLQNGVRTVVPRLARRATYNHPETNCVVCGKTTTAHATTVQDTSGWTNGHNHGCESYAAKWCENGGAKAGSEWTLGATYNHPEANCVVCGKQ